MHHYQMNMTMQRYIPNSMDLSVFSENAVVYVAGFLVKNIVKHFESITYQQALFGEMIHSVCIIGHKNIHNEVVIRRTVLRGHDCLDICRTVLWGPDCLAICRTVIHTESSFIYSFIYL